MKTRTFYTRWAAALVAASIILVGCNSKKGGDGDDKKDGGGEAKAKSASVKELVQGAWAPDIDSVLSMMAQGNEITDEMKEQMMPMAEMMASSMVIELRDGHATIHKPGEPEKETYEFVSTDEATGDYEVKMVNADGSDEIGKGNVKGDTMTMTSDGITMKLNRLSEEEFEKRKKAISEVEIPGGG